MDKEEYNSASRERYKSDPDYAERKRINARKQYHKDPEKSKIKAAQRRKERGHLWPSKQRKGRGPTKLGIPFKSKTKEYGRIFYRLKRDDPEYKKKQKAKSRRTYLKHKERRLADCRAYYYSNKGIVPHLTKEYQAARAMERYRSDLNFRIQSSLRGRIYKAVSGLSKKSAKTAQLLGCDLEYLKMHLESQFKEGMHWNNYGPVWHIDHNRPCCSFDLSDPEQQKECFHWTNLQPLFKAENLKKSGKWQEEIING